MPEQKRLWIILPIVRIVSSTCHAHLIIGMDPKKHFMGVRQPMSLSTGSNLMVAGVSISCLSFGLCGAPGFFLSTVLVEWPPVETVFSPVHPDPDRRGSRM
ncbi:hypothetical protein RRG08_016560 [Elysia crispata]|uniref:Uncharacterized protein n=1 Tax=Elysia crispata TaxID=231223 RepID=A0AAE1E3W1_9GAST|nr:hypothetical protein RRG08_016560 [Elysia crispata]